MNFFISIVIILSCLCTGNNARSGEYHPAPEIIDAVTEYPQIGNYYKFHSFLYPDPYWHCYTAQEAAAFRSLNPSNSTPMNPDMGTCQKCSGGLTLRTYNGSELCIQDCQAPYQLGTYNGTDGCITCPVNYRFTGGTCWWDGPGPPPPQPPRPSPTVPAGLTASDGTSPVNVIIKWNRSNSITEYYVLERAAGREEPFIWWKIGTIRDFLKSEYFDKSAKVATWYSYRIKACNVDNQCSGYSNLDKGYKALETPDPVGVETPGDNPTWVRVSWSSVPGAEGYLILVSTKENRYFARFGFAYTDDQKLTYNGERRFFSSLGLVEGNKTDKVFRELDLYFPLLRNKNRAIFVIAYERDEGGGAFLSYPAVWNSSSPIIPSVRLLLFGEQGKNKK